MRVIYSRDGKVRTNQTIEEHVLDAVDVDHYEYGGELGQMKGRIDNLTELTARLLDVLMTKEVLNPNDMQKILDMYNLDGIEFVLDKKKKLKYVIDDSIPF